MAEFRMPFVASPKSFFLKLNVTSLLKLKNLGNNDGKKAELLKETPN